jgi:hypothetical protein
MATKDKEASRKRRRVVLTIDQKVEILQLLETSSRTAIAAKYGVGKTTITDIKRNKDKIIGFKREMTDMGMTRPAKIMKVGNDTELDKAIYMWFQQKRMEGMPMSGAMLCEKATWFSQRMCGEGSSFSASSGWLWRFCKRHGIRSLSMQGEKLSANVESAEEFCSTFQSFIKKENFSLDQIFNCDETGLYFRLLPDKTLASFFEKSPAGSKKSKDRVTVSACANASGRIKLSLLLIGKSKRPRCFRNVKTELLPVLYEGQKNAWMTASLFKEWFHNNFVPHVREKLTSFGLEPKAVLLLDNCSAHPDPQELVSDDGKIFAKFLPPNVTSLIQPMDQGVLISLKRRYRKKLLHRLIIADEMGTSIIEFLKGLNMKTTVDLVAEAWDGIPSVTLQRSWRKILPLTYSSSDTSGNGDNGMNESHGVNEHTVGRSENDPTVDDFISTLAELHYEVSADEVSEWLECDNADPGVQLLSDDEIWESYDRF